MNESFSDLRKKQIKQDAVDEQIKQAASIKAKYDYYYMDQLMSCFGMSFDRSMSFLFALNFNYFAGNNNNNEDD